MKIGILDQALDAVMQALAVSDAQEERYHEPAIRRLKGELLRWQLA
jgi:hypothetical protein